MTIRYGNGDWVKQSHRTEKDGSWTDTTTTKQGDHYVTRTSTGHGSETEKSVPLLRNPWTQPSC